uniref:Hematopoietic death receptor n=1 Tax=Gasterosteus aculeatus aculeatus TaxID=481459 RepID=G3NP78_GASAC|nr:hematopoietic death receptor isoform X1 [Gasterosteus aculeatus aculeatus]
MDKRLVFCILIVFLKPSGAFPQPKCKDGLENTNGVCCSKCPAGKRQASPCTQHGEEGKCEECDDGTFIEHANVLHHCLKCTQCRPEDQEVVRQCTHTQDGECQCKAGGFCAPDQPCEVCRKCSRCKKDEVMVRNCTATSNTECKKGQLDASPASGNALWWLPVLVIGVFVAIGVLGCFVLKRRTATDSPMNPHDKQKAGNSDSDEDSGNERSSGEAQRLSCLGGMMPWRLVRASGAEEERKALRDSPGSSASNSQHNLTAFPYPYPGFPAPPAQAGPTAPVQPDRREEEEEEFPELVAVNGEESLRKCFEYFEDVDVRLHSRFFRHLDVADNVIKSKDHLAYYDRIHELLTIWVEKAGRGATLNDLLRALLNLKQRRTAEIIKEKAIRNGHYVEAQGSP